MIWLDSKWKGTPSMEQKRGLVYLSAVIYTLITGFSFLFGKIALNYASPMDILAHRFSAALIALMGVQLFRGSFCKLTRAKFIRILPLTLFYPLLFFTFQTYGLQKASSSEAGIIFAAIPIFTWILAALFLKEKTNRIQKLCIMASVSGVVYISWQNGTGMHFSISRGILLLLVSALSYAAYSILAKKMTKNFSSVEMSCTMIIISFVCFNLLAIGRHLYNDSISCFWLPLVQADYVTAVVYLGVLSSLVTALLTNYVLSKLEASKMSVFGNLATVISILAGFLFLKEQLTPHHVIGSILIVGGVLGVNFLGDERLKH